MEKTNDILARIGKEKRRNQILIGFSAETENTIKNAKKKVMNKNLDLIVANDISIPNSGFGKDNNFTYIAIGDVSGKGEKANIIVNTIRNILHSLIEHKPSYDLLYIIKYLNTFMYDNVPSNMFMSLNLCCSTNSFNFGKS